LRVSFFCCTFVPIFNTSKDMAAEEQERGYVVQDGDIMHFRFNV